MSGRADNRYMLLLCAVAAVGGYLFGYDTAVISGTVSQVASRFGLDAMRQGWYVGCALVGSIAGVAVAGVVNDSLGRKAAMLLSATLFTVSAAGCAFPESFAGLVAYRVIGGVGIGMVSITSPMYISEIAPAHRRGRMVSLYQLAITMGFLGAYLINYAILANAQGGGGAQGVVGRLFFDEPWRGMLGMETLPAALFLVVLSLIPESPRWQTVRGRERKARATLTRILGSELRADEQMAEILGTRKETGTRSPFREKGIRKAVAVGVCIAILGQLMGVNAVLYYGPSIFENAGLSGGDSLFYQVLVGAVNMLTSLLALAIIDRVGRKRLIYYGVSGMILSLLAIAFCFICGARLGLPNGVLLGSFLLYVFCCAGSISAVVWVLLSEMYPTRIRGAAMSAAGFALWVGTYLIGQLTPWMLSTLTPAGTFLFFAAMCVPYMLIMWRMVPQTSGVPLEEIERHWES